jgi:hypothetical protein
MREREERARKQREEQQMADDQNQRSLDIMQRLVETDDLLPDEARNVAAQHFVRLSMNPKAKDKDFATAMQEVFAAANQPRRTPRTVAADSLRQTAQADARHLAVPGAPFPVPRLPSPDVLDEINRLPEFVSGILRPEEIQSRKETAIRRNLELQQEYAGPKVVPFSETQGLYDVRAGQQIRAPQPAAPKTDYSRTPFEVLIDPNATPEQKAIAERAMTLQYTNQGDQMRAGGTGASKPLRLNRQIFQNPNGTFVEILTDPYDPSAPPVRRELGGNIAKPLGDAALNAKAQTEGTVRMLTDLLTKFDTGQVNPNEVFGKWNELGYKARSSGWLPFLDAPDAAESDVRTDLANFNNELTKLRSGAAVSAQEWARLSRELPIAGMAPEEVVNRIRRVVERLRRIYVLRYGPNGVGDANAFPGDVEASPATPTAPAAPTTVAAPTPAAVAPKRLPPPPPPPGARLIQPPR